jgi:hypothetical protein
MLTNKKKLVIGIGIAIGLYFAFRYGLKNVFVKKPESIKNFANADGELVGKFFAKQYDPLHVNPDGSKGATWISYDDSNVVGYWQKGRVQEGTEMSVV